ncbi:hypothetical protein Tco_0552921 [Tanacetum coccineum]
MFKFKIRWRFFKRCLDFIICIDGIFSNGDSSVSDSDSEFSSSTIVMNSLNSKTIFFEKGSFDGMEDFCILHLEELDIKDHSFSPNSEIELFLFNSNNCINSVKKGSSQDERNFTVLFHFENNEISKKSKLPTSTSIFSAILTGYWNDLSANLTLILVGLRVSRDSFAYKEYDIRLMLAPKSAKALQENVLLKLNGIRKLPGSPSFGGTLFWIIAELSSLRKAA